MKHLKRRILSLGLVFVLAVTTLLSGVGITTVHAATDDTMIAISPWAYGNGVMDNTQTYSDGGYEYATVVTGSDNTSAGARMKDIDLSLYSKIHFAVKSDGTNYYQIGKVIDNWEQDSDIASGNSAEWKKIILVDEGLGYFQMYVNDTWVNYQFPLDMNLSDLQMKFDASGTLVMTEVRGILRDGAASSLIPISNCILSGTGTDVSETVEKPIPEATKITQMTTTWLWNPMLSVNLEKYTKLKFYARNTADGAAWIEMKVGEAGAEGSCDTYGIWTEVLFIKNADKTWNVYIAGTLKLKNVSISNLNELRMNFGNNTYYLSQVFAVKDSEWQPTDAMVATSPWAYGSGTMNNEQSYSDGDYEYATVITGSDSTYAGARMKDVDLSLYSTVRFAVKSDGSAWYEIGKVADNSYNTIVGTSEEWKEIKLVDEGDSYFQMYLDANKIAQFPLNMNLSDLQMKLGNGGHFVMTEVRGTLRTGAVSQLEILQDCVYPGTGTDVTDTVEKPISEATKITQMKTDSAYHAMPDVNLKKYSKLKFYARNTVDGQAWIEMKVGEAGASVACDTYGSWTEVLFIKNADKTWNVYLAGTLKLENLSISNLNALHIKFGDYIYYFSQMFAVAEAGPTDAMVAISPWAYGNGTMDNEQSYSDGGYEYATVVTGSNSTYAGARMKDIDLSLYSKIHFAVKSDGINYYQIGKVSDNWAQDRDIASGNSAEWKEIILVDEDRGYFQMYVDTVDEAGWRGHQFQLNMNLSDLQMKFGTSGTLVMTEVRGTLRDGATSQLETVSDCVYAGTGTDVSDTVEKPVYEASKITEATIGWQWRQLPALDLKDYVKVKFYVRDKNGTSPYLEIKEDNVKAHGATTIRQSWTEVVLIRNASNTWDVYIAGEVQNYDPNSYSQRLQSLSIANLSDLQINYGLDGTYYLSEVFAVKREHPSGDVNQDYETNSCDLVHEKKALGGTYNELYDLNGDGFVDNTDVKKLRYILLDVAEGDMVLNVENTVLLNAESQAQYQLDYNSEDEFAAQEFATFMQESTGANYVASTADKKIVIGKAKASAANMSFAGLTTDNGYAIRTKGNDIYVYGNTTQGTLNGVYELLNRAIDLEIYTGDCYTYSHTAGTAITLHFTDANAVFNPGIDYQYDLNGETRKTSNSTYQKRLSYVTDYLVLGGSAHAEYGYLESVHGSGNVKDDTYMTLDAETADAMASWFYSNHVKSSAKSKFLLGLKDSTGWYKDTPIGQGRTDEFVTFANKVVEKISSLMKADDPSRKITVVLMAYNNTVMAPSVSLQPKSNVKLGVMYAPVQANWYKPLTDSVNAKVPICNSTTTFDADDEFRKWQATTEKAGGEIMLWSYDTFFDSYLTPFDCIDSMYDNYQLAAELGVTGIYDQVQYDNDVATDWNRLKVYLRSKLAKNPNMTEEEYNQLITDFMNAYFGPAAETMKSVLASERTLIQNIVYANASNNSTFSQNYGCGKAAVMVTSKGNYEKWGLEQSGGLLSGYIYSYSGELKTDIYNKMEAALSTIATKVSAGNISEADGDVYQKRIKLEMLAIRYVLLSTPQKTDSSNSDTFAQLATDCVDLGLTMVSEGNAVSEANLKAMARWN